MNNCENHGVENCPTCFLKGAPMMLKPLTLHGDSWKLSDERIESANRQVHGDIDILVRVQPEDRAVANAQAEHLAERIRDWSHKCAHEFSSPAAMVNALLIKFDMEGILPL